MADRFPALDDITGGRRIFEDLLDDGLSTSYRAKLTTAALQQTSRFQPRGDQATKPARTTATSLLANVQH